MKASREKVGLTRSSGVHFSLRAFRHVWRALLRKGMTGVKAEN